VRHLPFGNNDHHIDIQYSIVTLSKAKEFADSQADYLLDDYYYTPKSEKVNKNSLFDLVEMSNSSQ
jgi:hypothetical protein